MAEFDPIIAVRYLERKIKNGQLPPDVMSKDGVTARSKEEALQWLQECHDNEITAL